MAFDADGNQVIPDEDEIQGVTLDSGESELEDDEESSDGVQETEEKTSEKVTEEEQDSDDSEEEVKDEVEDTEAAAESEQEEPEVIKPDDYYKTTRRMQKRYDKLTKEKSELRDEIAELRKRLDEQESKRQEDQTKSEISVMQQRIQNATAYKNQLLSDGEYEKVAEVDNDIMDMKIYLNSIAVKRDNKQENPTTEVPVSNEQPKPKEQQIPEVQRTWIESNERFRNDTHYRNYVNNVYDELLADGYEADDPELYEVLNERIGFQPKPKLVENKKTTRPPAAPPPNTGKQDPVTKKPSKLTSQDLKMIEDWGLNANDPEVRKEYLRNKLA